MKKIVSLGVISVITFTGIAVSAQEMMGNTSMNMDTMMEAKSMSETKMKSSSTHMDSSIGNHMGIQNKTTLAIAKMLGYNWKKDRKMLAQMAGIQGYRGTQSQNMMLKKYLISLYTESVMVGGAPMIKSRDIVDNAVRAKNVTTVVAAVKAAGLVETLKSEGPFTVFAPDNAAFEKLPAGTVETLLKTENKAKLVDILTYHVVAGKYTSENITDGLTLKTVEGKNLTFKKDASGKIWINGAAMIGTKDVISTNGVTHVIDTVLLPPQ